MKNFLILGLCLSLVGCADVSHQVKSFTGLEYGMTRKQMTDLLGRPDAVEIYKKSDGDRVEYDIYVSISGDKVPVCLVDNRVMGWGKTFYEDHFSMDDTRIK